MNVFLEYLLSKLSSQAIVNYYSLSFSTLSRREPVPIDKPLSKSKGFFGCKRITLLGGESSHYTNRLARLVNDHS